MTQKQWLRTYAVSLFVISALLAVPSVAQTAHNGAPAPGAPSNVLVVNTPAQPVPTAAQGTTTVAGTVSLSAGTTVNVGNSPSVSVTNTPTVNLATGTSLAVTNPADNHGGPAPLVVTQAYHPIEDSCYVMFNGSNVGSCLFQPVPSGQRLVIQEVDAAIALETTLRPTDVFLNTGVSHYMTATVMASNAGGFDYLATHQQTHLYLNGGNTPSCNVFLTGNSSGGNVHCSLTGYLEDLN